MKNIKKDFIVILSILTVAFVSCKSNEKPEEKTFIVSSIVGTWTSAIGETYKFTVKDDGEVTATFPVPIENFNNLTVTVTLTIDSWYADKDKEVKKYEKTLTGTKVKVNNMMEMPANITCAFTFNSANSCYMTATISGNIMTQQIEETIENIPFIK